MSYIPLCFAQSARPSVHHSKVSHVHPLDNIPPSLSPNLLLQPPPPTSLPPTLLPPTLPLLPSLLPSYSSSLPFTLFAPSPHICDDLANLFTTLFLLHRCPKTPARKQSSLSMRGRFRHPVQSILSPIETGIGRNGHARHGGQENCPNIGPSKRGDKSLRTSGRHNTESYEKNLSNFFSPHTSDDSSQESPRPFALDSLHEIPLNLDSPPTQSFIKQRSTQNKSRSAVTVGGRGCRGDLPTSSQSSGLRSPRGAVGTQSQRLASRQGHLHDIRGRREETYESLVQVQRSTVNPFSPHSASTAKKTSRLNNGRYEIAIL